MTINEVTSITGISPPPCIRRYGDYLKQKYQMMSSLPDNDWPPEITTPEFVNLAIIERKKYEQPGHDQSETMAFDYAYGKIDSIVARKEEVQLEKVFYPKIRRQDKTSLAIINQLCILVDGAPGVGKTTLTRNIAKQWSNDNLLKEYHLVLLIPLREIDKDTIQLEDLIHADDDDLKKEVVRYIKKTSGKRIMFILDGFDELQKRHRSRGLILEMLQAKIIHDCSFVVCSRPYASQDLAHLHHINRHVEVIGFRQEQISQCIIQNLNSAEAKQLIHEIEERLDVKSICYIPLNCKIAIFVYKQQNFKLPATLTKLYELFILHTVKHYMQKVEHSTMEDVQEAQEIDGLPKSILDHLNGLSKIAYSSLKEHTILVSHKLLFENLPREILMFGLLNSINCYGASGISKKYQFMHLTIQEFFAARFVASLEKSEVKAIFKVWLKEKRFRMSSLFLAGLTGLAFVSPDRDNSEGMVVFTQDSQDRNAVHSKKDTALFLAQLNYESNSTCSHWLHTKLGSTCIDMSGYSLSTFDCLVLAKYLCSAPEEYVWDNINLNSCGLTNTFMQILSAETKHRFLTIGKAKRLNLGYNSIPIKTIIQILGESNNYLVELELPSMAPFNRDDRIYHDNIFQIVSRFNKSETLRRVSDGNNDISKDKLLLPQDLSTPWCSKTLKEVLLFLDPLEVSNIELPLALRNCNVCNSRGIDAVTVLSTILSKCLKLKELTLTRYLTFHAFRSIITSLLSRPAPNNSLHLDFGIIGSNSKGLAYLLEVMQHFAHTRLIACGMRLDFKRNTGRLRVKGYYKDPERYPDQHPIEYDTLFLSLSMNRHVRELDLSGNNKLNGQFEGFSSITCSEKVGQAIKAMLLTNTSLIALNLSCCQLSNTLMVYLADGLKDNTNLEELNVANNYSHNAWSHFFSNISHSRSLKRLIISKNNLSHETLRQFLSERGRQLVVLKMTDCDLKDEDIAAVTNFLSSGVLEELHMSGDSGISNAGWMQLFDCLANNNTLLRMGKFLAKVLATKLI